MRTLWLSLALAACSGGTKDPADDTDAADDTDVADDTDGADDTDAADDTDVDDTDPVTDDTDPTADADADGSPAGVDCDDSDPTVFPGAVELCDGQDNDCEPTTGEAGQVTFFPDAAGAPVDLTQVFTDGGTVTAPAAGAVRICGGEWPASLAAAAGAELRVIGDPAFSPPVLPNGVTFQAEGLLQWVAFTRERVTAGRDALLQLTDVRFTGAELWTPRGASVIGERVRAEASSYTWLRTLGDGGAPPPPNPIELVDSTFHDVPALFAGAVAVTLRDCAFTGGAGFGSATSALIEDTTFETAGGSVSGGDATLRRVTSTLSTNLWSFTNVPSLVIEDSDVHGVGAAFLVSLSNVTSAVVRGSDLSAEGTTFQHINASDSHLTVEDSSFTGPGTHIRHAGVGSLTVADTTFTGATDSALKLQGPAATSVARCTFTANDGGGVDGGISFTAAGGAMNLDNEAATTTVTDTVFSANTGQNYGGAIFLRAGALTLTNSTFAGNTSPSGGAIATWFTPASLSTSGCTFTDNAATFGGAVYLATTAPTTFTGGAMHRNAATSQGGAVFMVGPMTLTNVDLGTGATANTPEDLWASSISTGYDLDGAVTIACTEAGCP